MNTIRFEQLSNLPAETLLSSITLSEVRQIASTSMQQLGLNNHDQNKSYHLQQLTFDLIQLHDQLCVAQAFTGTDPSIMEVLCGLLYNNFGIPHNEGHLIVLKYFGANIGRPIQLGMDVRNRFEQFVSNGRHYNTGVIVRLRQAMELGSLYGYGEVRPNFPEELNRLIDGINKFFNVKDLSKTVTIGEFRIYGQLKSTYSAPQLSQLQTLMNRVELMDHANHLMASLTGMSSGSDNPQTVVYEHMLELAERYFEGCDKTSYLAMLTVICFGEALLSTNHLNITQVLRDRVLMIVPPTHPYYQNVLNMLQVPNTGAWNRFGATSAGSNVHVLNLPQEVEKAFREYHSGNMDELIGYMTRGLMSNIIACTGHDSVSLPNGFIPDDVYRFGGIINKAELVIRKIGTHLGVNPNEISYFTPILTNAAESLSRLLEVRVLDNIKPLTKALLFGMKSNVRTALTQQQLDKLDELLDDLELEPVHQIAVRESYMVEVRPTKASDDMKEILRRANAEAALDHAMVDGLINISHEATPSKIKAFWLDMVFTPVDQLKGKYPTVLFDAVHNGVRRMAEEEHGIYKGALELLTALHELRIESVEEPEEEINSLNNIVLRARNNATEILKEESPWIFEVDELTKEQIDQIKELCKNPLYTLALATLPIKTWEEDTLYEGEDAVVVGLKDVGDEELGEPDSLGSVSECTTIIEHLIEGMKELNMSPRPCESNLHELLSNYFSESGTSLNQLISSLALIYGERDATLESKNAIAEAYEFCVNNGEQETSISYLPEVNIGRLLHLVLNK